MGRRRLKIQRLECVKARQAKYSKRKIGILKKAKELAILCDIDLALLMFSPTGKPTLYVGQDKDFGTVLDRMSALTFEEREER
uniref:MADS-box domain-containing protein n=1 Tax=Populus trichocarpa TaxID=3694 RepID=B9IKF0_POPTR